jgi:hypothetical protein
MRYLRNLFALTVLVIGLVSAVGCQSQEAAMKEAEKQFGEDKLKERDDMTAKIKAMHERTGGDFNQLNAEERAVIMKWTLNNEFNARRAFAEIGGQAKSQADVNRGQ